MADLSKELDDIAGAGTGADMRLPLSEALRKLAEQGRDTKTLNCQDEDFYAKQTDMATILPLDAVPKYRSKKAATSGGIFSMIGDLDDIDWGSDEWLT